jgi:sporulation protein YlmC with PRC-barrel domain
MAEQRITLSASTLIGDQVINAEGEDLGHIKDIMIDVRNGTVAYAVLSFGGFLGMGDKLFAIPWQRLQLSEKEKRFYLDVDKEMLEEAPSFDKDHWPDMSASSWREEVDVYYSRF